MKLKYPRKLQKTSGSVSSSIPSSIREAFELEKGDTIIWVFDIDTKQVSIEVPDKEQ